MTLSWWNRVMAPEGTVGRGVGAEDDEVYVALPGPKSPSILADAASSAAVRGALVRPAAGMARREALMRSAAARAAANDRLRRRLPNLVHVSAGAGSTLRAELGKRLGHDVRLWATAGPVRPNRKPVVRVLDTDDRIVAFAKVGWDRATADLVGTEADALGSLRERPCRGLIVPDVIDFFSWSGLSILMTRPLPIDDAPAAEADAEVAALGRLVAYGGRSREALAASDYWQSLRGRLGRLDHLAEAEERQSGEHLVDFGGYHGDWSPWNIRRTVSDLGLYVWDWERSRTDGPIGVDVAHYVMQVGRFVDGQTVAAAAARAQDALVEHLGSFEVDPGGAALLVRIELLETVARMVESGLADELVDRRDEIVSVLESMRPAGAPT
ncbi:MAG: hypothetical protein ACR2QE_07370 [Acidimicrobiales bacterium]